MAEDAIELGFEAFDKVTHKYHDLVYDRTARFGQIVYDRWGNKRVVDKNGVARPVGPQRQRSSSVPPENFRQDTSDLERAEAGIAAGAAGAAGELATREPPASDVRRRDRIYVDEQGMDYFVPASRYNTQDDTYRMDRLGPQDRGRSSRSARRSGSESGRSRRSSRHGLIPEAKKSTVHHVAAAVAGGVAGGFVGQTAGRGDISVALLGAVFGAVGAGLADKQLEKKHREREEESKKAEDKRRRKKERERSQ